MKFLIILVLIVYVFYKIAGSLFKIVFGNFRNDPRDFQQRQQHSRKTAEGLNIDKTPTHKQNSNTSGYKGGEYIDFEEV